MPARVAASRRWSNSEGGAVFIDSPRPLLNLLRLPKYIATVKSLLEEQQRLGLGQLLVRLLYHYRQDVMVEAERLGFGDIRSPHLQVLAHLSNKGTRLTKLADRAQLSLAAASEFVTELEELGYVAR